MILGLDTRGHVYLTLTQSNSNAKLMEIFFHALANKLDSERPGWRKDTVILLDHAPYHSSQSTQKVLEKL